jgi:hypothetical protein
VQEAAKDGEQAGRLAFRDEMLKLGHKERVKNLYRIKDKLTAKPVFFQLNGPQLDFLYNHGTRNIILKCRQVGMTVLNCVRALDLALWEQNMTTGIMAHNKDRIKEIFDDKTKFTYRWFKKDWGSLYKPTEKFNSRNELTFTDDGLGRELNSRLIVTFDARGSTYQLLHISEAAFVENERIQASIEGVPETGEVTYESTPNGMGGVFYETWRNVRAKRTQFKGFFVPWFHHYPEMPEKISIPADFSKTSYEKALQKEYPKITDKHLLWRRHKIYDNYQGDSDAFEVAYPTDDIKCFDAGVGKVFSAAIVRAQREFTKEPKEVGFLSAKTEKNKIIYSIVPSAKGDVAIWVRPQRGHSYAMGADPAGGIGKDRSAAYIFDLSTKETVARVWGQIDPADFGNILDTVGKMYNTASICVEENGHGDAVIQKLKELQYPRLYKRRVIDEFTAKPTQKIGFRTTTQSKLTLTEGFKEALKDLKFKILDIDLINEMTTFVQIAGRGTNVKRQATAGAFDDLVMAAALTQEAAKYLTNIITWDNSTYDTPYRCDPDTGFPIF